MEKFVLHQYQSFSILRSLKYIRTHSVDLMVMTILRLSHSFTHGVQLIKFDIYMSIKEV